MATTDARPVPIKNTAFRATFGIYKNDGTLITGATALDSEVSKDGAAFADCTNEATEISQGVYYLDLTSTEMNADSVVVVVKTTSTGAVPPVIALYPQEAGDIRVDVNTVDGNANAAANLSRAARAMVPFTVATGSTSTSLNTDLTEATNDHYKGRQVLFVTGALAGQFVDITAYNGTSKALTVTATPTAESPANTDLAIIV